MSATNENPERIEITERKPDCGAAHGSETVNSANAWAELGREATRKCGEAIEAGKFGTAEYYLKTADSCFAKEMRLRDHPKMQLVTEAESPNDKLSHGGDNDQ